MREKLDKSQAEAAAEALMGSGLRRHEEIRNRRAAAIDRKQRVTKFVIAGGILGVAVSFVAGASFLLGLNLGALAGLVAGWFMTRPNRGPAER